MRMMRDSAIGLLGSIPKEGLFLAAAVLALALLALVLPSYLQTVVTRILIFALFAISLDILWGFTGLFSLGHAAFLGIGGYAAGISMVRYDVDVFWAGLGLGLLAAAVFGAIFGLIALRMSGAYFLLVTLALGQLAVALGFRWPFLWTHGGTEGVFGIVHPSLGLPWSDAVLGTREFYWLVLGVSVACFGLLRRVVASPVGYAWRGIRQNDRRMEALGYNTWAFRYLSFVLAATVAGAAGVLLAYHNGFVVPADLGIEMSTLVLLMVLIGGPGTLIGPIIGAAAIIILELVVSTYTPDRWPLVLGTTYVLAVVFAKGGILQRLTDLARRRRMSIPPD